MNISTRLLFLLIFELFSTILPAKTPISDCFFKIGWSLDGLHLTAFLTAEPPAPPPPTEVIWLLDGQNLDTAATLDFTFSQLGGHILCAKYVSASGDTCTVCQAIRVFPTGDDCLDFKLLNPAAGCGVAFEPVCGCDGVSYGNSCAATSYHGVKRVWRGPCGSACMADLKVDFKFSEAGQTVSFTDLTTYSPANGLILGWFWLVDNNFPSGEQNPVFPNLAAGDHRVCLNVKASNAGGPLCESTFCSVISTGQPPCVDASLIDSNILCPAVYDPVCGCDGQIYANECVAKYHFGLLSWTTGECGHACFEKSWVVDTMPCLAIYDPVCGCDGKEYENDCEALFHHGITAWTRGKCTVSTSENGSERLAATVFPNPTAGLISIKMTGGALKKCSIFDSTGRFFMEKSTSDLDLSDLPSGLFFLKIEAASGAVLVEKLSVFR